MKKKKLVYLAHPISGDVEANLADIRRIVRKLNIEREDIIPCVPYYCDVVSLDDSVPAERRRGIDNCLAVIDALNYDELWLTGEKISIGMQEEIKEFRKHGKLIFDYTNKF